MRLFHEQCLTQKSNNRHAHDLRDSNMTSPIAHFKPVSTCLEGAGQPGSHSYFSHIINMLAFRHVSHITETSQRIMYTHVLMDITLLYLSARNCSQA